MGEELGRKARPESVEPDRPEPYPQAELAQDISLPTPIPSGKPRENMISSIRLKFELL